MNPFPNTPGVYKIIDAHSGKVYVGSSSVSIRARILSHCSSLRKLTHQNKQLQDALSLTPDGLFILQALEVFEVGVTRELVMEREQFWIEELGSINPSRGFNKIQASIPDTRVIARNKFQSKEELKKDQARRMRERWANKDNRAALLQSRIPSLSRRPKGFKLKQKRKVSPEGRLRIKESKRGYQPHFNVFIGKWRKGRCKNYSEAEFQEFVKCKEVEFRSSGKARFS